MQCEKVDPLLHTPVAGNAPAINTIFAPHIHIIGIFFNLLQSNQEGSLSNSSNLAKLYCAACINSKAGSKPGAQNSTWLLFICFFNYDKLTDDVFFVFFLVSIRAYLHFSSWYRYNATTRRKTEALLSKHQPSYRWGRSPFRMQTHPRTGEMSAEVAVRKMAKRCERDFVSLGQRRLGIWRDSPLMGQFETACAEILPFVFPADCLFSFYRCRILAGLPPRYS